ncbi:MAG: Transcriptional regulator, Xre family, partial [uncultured Sphingomonadaceae bacterium]
GHAPHPALAVDRQWNLVAANEAVTRLTAGADSSLLEAPTNVLRLSLHPKGLAPNIANLRQWRAHVLARLNQQIDASADPGLVALLEELKAYPVPPGARPHRPALDPLAGIAVPFELRTPDGALSFLSTTTVFGTAVDITLAELTIETFFPADAETAALMRGC